MYLEHNEYRTMGGVLEQTAYVSLERKARYLINSQANGRTGARIAKLTEIPECIKECVFELVNMFASENAGGRQIASESQSQGGASESVSYVTKTDAQITEQGVNIIYNSLYGGNYGHLLYLGVEI